MGDSEIINANEQLPISIKRELHVPSQSLSIVLQNIDNINEYYGIIEIEIINKLIIDNNKILKFPIPINKEETSSLSNTREKLQGGGDNQNTEKILKALNKFLTKHKYIDKNKLYTLYNNDNNVVCIIAEFDNIYIIQIKEDFYKNNDKILKKYNKDDVKTKLEKLYNTPNNLQKLLS